MKYTLKQLEEIPTITQGQTDDLKLEELETRVWLSRMTIEDGQPYNNQVTVEQVKYINGVPTWKTIKQYEAK